MPDRRNVSSKLRTNGVLLVRGQILSIAVTKRIRHAIVSLKERAPNHLGRMRGEHELDVLRARNFVHARGVDARGDHLCNRVAARIESRLHDNPARGAHLGNSSFTHLVSLLGDVRKCEEERKGPSDFAHYLGRERLDNRVELR